MYPNISYLQLEQVALVFSKKGGEELRVFVVNYSLNPKL
jgi:hypothetical protein